MKMSSKDQMKIDDWSELINTRFVGDCGAGFYCPTGTVDQQPASTPCPIGHYCPGGTALPVPCQNGTYVSISG